MSNLALCAIGVFGALFTFQVWLCEGLEDDDMYTPFFWFSVVVIPLLFYVAASSTLSLHNLAPEAAARERQSAAAFEALERNLEGRIHLTEAACVKQINFCRDQNESLAESISACQKDFKSMRERDEIQTRVIGGLELELKYAKQSLNQDRSVPTTKSADKKALEATVASLQKAQEELAELKYARDLAVVPVDPFVAAAADPAAHVVCEHQGLLAEKTKVDGLLAAEKRDSQRKDLKVTAQSTMLAQKDRLLAQKDEEAEEAEGGVPRGARVRDQEEDG